MVKVVGWTSNVMPELTPPDLDPKFDLAPDAESGPFYELVGDIIHQSVPDGIEIKRTSWGGMGLFAKRAFPYGTTLYIGRQIIIPNVYREFQLVTDQGSFALDTDTHSVGVSDTERWLYLFDSFMNHSCRPSTYSATVMDPASAPNIKHAPGGGLDGESGKNSYAVVAMLDIAAGDEITCDYNLFEFDCAEKTIEQCLCGSPDCIGRVAGFRYLPREQQKAPPPPHTHTHTHAQVS